MNRHHLAVLAAVAMTLPSALGALHGTLDVASALFRFIVALLVAWGGLSLLATLTAGYGGAPGEAGEAGEVEA